VPFPLRHLSEIGRKLKLRFMLSISLDPPLAFPFIPTLVKNYCGRFNLGVFLEITRV
jgi:hypothetical protein